MNKLFKIVLISSILLIFLVGFNYILTETQLVNNNSNVIVSNYNLGDFTFEENGNEITSPIKGSIGIPKEDNSPIVFVIHGSHLIDGDVTKPYAEGFEYLVEHLAKQGYLAISINVNRAFMFEPVEGDELYRMREIFAENYRRVKEAVEGKDNYPYSLKGKGDLSKINLIGHSRGGENIFNIIRGNEFKDISFTSAVLVAPSQNFTFTNSYADIPTAIIVPQYDTDVVQQDGLNYFYYAYYDDKARRNPIQYAYYYNADHNPFNSTVDQKGMFNYEGVTYVSPEEQRTFLKGYCTNFLNVYNKGEDYSEVFLNANINAYGTPYMPAYYFSERNGAKIIRPNESLRDLTYKGLDFSYIQTSLIPGEDTSGEFNLPGTYERIPLYKMKWKEKKGVVTFPIELGVHNFYDYSGISFLIGLDSSDKTNSSSKETALDIKIIDINDQEEIIRLSSKTTSALHYVEGSSNDYGNGTKKWNHSSK